MIGKADCGKPCYAYNQVLFNACPACNIANEKYENGTSQKQILDRETGQYKWEEFYNKENICLYFNFNENVDEMDVNFDKMCEFFDKEDPNKKVHWSFVDSEDNEVEKDLPIHYMMIDGQRFDFPYGLQMKEFFLLNDTNFFPTPKRDDWKKEGYCFGLKDKFLHDKIGKSIDYYGINLFHFVLYFQCVSC